MSQSNSNLKRENVVRDAATGLNRILYTLFYKLFENVLKIE